nr:MAG TPA: hypothetical protein [Caudoviricetes sp.]
MFSDNKLRHKVRRSDNKLGFLTTSSERRSDNKNS